MVVQGESTFCNDVLLLKDLDVNGGLDVEGDMVVQGESTFCNDVLLLDNLKVRESINVDGEFIVEGSSTFCNEVYVQSDLIVQNNLIINGSSTFSNDVDFLDVATFESNASMMQDLLVSGSLFSKNQFARLNLDEDPGKNSFELGVRHIVYFSSNVSGALETGNENTFSVDSDGGLHINQNGIFSIDVYLEMTNASLELDVGRVGVFIQTEEENSTSMDIIPDQVYFEKKVDGEKGFINPHFECFLEKGHVAQIVSLFEGASSSTTTESYITDSSYLTVYLQRSIQN